MLRSWSRIFLSSSASVNVSNKGQYCSASWLVRVATSTIGSGVSLERASQSSRFSLRVRHRTCTTPSYDANSVVHEHCRQWPWQIHRRVLYIHWSAIGTGMKSLSLPNSAAKTRANSSGLFPLSDMSHSNWSTKLTLPMWMFNWMEKTTIGREIRIFSVLW